MVNSMWTRTQPQRGFPFVVTKAAPTLPPFSIVLCNEGNSHALVLATWVTTNGPKLSKLGPNLCPMCLLHAKLQPEQKPEHLQSGEGGAVFSQAAQIRSVPEASECDMKEEKKQENPGGSRYRCGQAVYSPAVFACLLIKLFRLCFLL